MVLFVPVFKSGQWPSLRISTFAYLMHFGARKAPILHTSWQHYSTKRLVLSLVVVMSLGDRAAGMTRCDGLWSTDVDPKPSSVKPLFFHSYRWKMGTCVESCQEYTRSQERFQIGRGLYVIAECGKCSLQLAMCKANIACPLNDGDVEVVNVAKTSEARTAYSFLSTPNKIRHMWVGVQPPRPDGRMGQFTPLGWGHAGSISCRCICLFFEEACLISVYERPWQKVFI